MKKTMWTHRALTLAAGLMVLGLTLSCASLPEEVERIPSSAFTEPETTYLGRFFANGMAANPGQNGFFVLDSGEQALRARLAVIEVAERSIDAQCPNTG